MKIVRFERFGPADEVCACVDAPDPGEPGPDEVVVRVEAFPINPVDLLIIEGVYAHRPELPAVPGSEGVGVVEAAGAGVANVAQGDRVMLMGRETWAEKRLVGAQEVMKVPLPDDAAAGADVAQLAMLKINPATAALLLRSTLTLRPGDWVIQNAANSGVGKCLIRLARLSGIRTVNVVRREALVQPLTAIGGDAVVVDGDGLAARVRDATGGADVRLGIDAVGGMATLRLAECLGPDATVVCYGRLSGEACQVPPNKVIFEGLTLTGFWLVRHLSAMSTMDRMLFYTELAGLIADGTLKTDVEAVYAIEDVRAALEHAAREGRSGKVLVAPGGPVGG